MPAVTATYAHDDRPAGGHPLRPGASPAAIRDALLATDQGAFDAAYAAALAASRESLDLGELFQTLEHWRRLALLQSDPENFAHMVRRVAETLTGEPVLDGEPFELTRARAGLQVYRVVADDQVQRQLDALSAAALVAFAELRVLLEVDTWAGGPANPANPGGPVRTMSFGPGHEGVAAYLILDSRRRVDLVQIAWLG